VSRAARRGTSLRRYWSGTLCRPGGATEADGLLASVTLSVASEASCVRLRAFWLSVWRASVCRGREARRRRRGGRERRHPLEVLPSTRAPRRGASSRLLWNGRLPPLAILRPCGVVACERAVTPVRSPAAATAAAGRRGCSPRGRYARAGRRPRGLRGRRRRRRGPRRGRPRACARCSAVRGRGVRAGGDPCEVTDCRGCRPPASEDVVREVRQHERAGGPVLGEVAAGGGEVPVEVDLVPECGPGGSRVWTRRDLVRIFLEKASSPSPAAEAGRRPPG